MVTPVHITKRALAGANGYEGAENLPPAHERACGGPASISDVQAAEVRRVAHRKHIRQAVTCPACLVLLDAELEGRGAEAQRLMAEIEAGR